MLTFGTDVNDDKMSVGIVIVPDERLYFPDPGDDEHPVDFLTFFWSLLFLKKIMDKRRNLEFQFASTHSTKLSLDSVHKQAALSLLGMLDS